MQIDLKNLPTNPIELQKIVLNLHQSMSARINTHVEKIATQTSTIENQTSTIEKLNTRIFLLERDKFGRRSEKFVDPKQPGIFNECEKEAEGRGESVSDDDFDEIEVAGYKKKKKRGGRAKLPEDLDRNETVYDIPEDQRFCPVTGKPMHKVGSKSKETLEIIPEQVRVQKDTVVTYACGCCDETQFKSGEAPRQVIEKGVASASLLSFIAVRKFADSLPLHRLEQMFARMDIGIVRQSMARWMIALAFKLKPLYELMHEDILAKGLGYADETTIQVLKEDGKSPSSKSYFWTLASGGIREGPDICLFKYYKTRSAAAALDLLSGFKGHLMCDGYDSYNNVCADPHVIRLACWAHVRRKFFEAYKVLKKQKSDRGSLAKAGLKMIRVLYRLESESKNMTPENRKTLRANKAKPILKKLKSWLEKSSEEILPSSPTGKAIAYAQSLWPALTVYADSGDLPIDNNYMERQIRVVAIGRKNWMFADTPAGAEASAILYSVVKTCQLQKRNPYFYLLDTLKKLPYAETTADFRNLLPY
jgi:transposase